MPLQVDIVTPRRLVYTGTANEVRAPGWHGEFGVLPGHDILLSLLRGGVCTVSTDVGEQKFVVGRGFVEAGPERVVLLTDSCEPAAEVDKATAEREAQEAEQIMGNAPGDSHEWRLAEERLEIARARLSV